MKYKSYSYNNANEIFMHNGDFKDTYENVLKIIDNITDDNLADKFEEVGKNSKSLSNTIYRLIEQKLIEQDWQKELHIFQDFAMDQSRSKRWTLDFYKNHIQLEIAFNHEEGTAWNIMKFQLAHQPNSYKQEQEVKIGILILATNQLKKSGGYDNSVGSYEKYIEYLAVFKPFVSLPLLLIGLQSPDEFKVKHRNINRKKIGQIKEI